LTVNGVTKKVTKVEKRERALLELILEYPNATTAEPADRLSVSRKTISLQIRVLKDKGMIVRRGSRTKGYWEITSDE